MYIYPYKASMLTPCPFEQLKLGFDASREEINRAAEEAGTDEADEARHRALSIYHHPPCIKARRQRRIMEQDKGGEEERHRRKVVEKVIVLYKTEFYHIGLRGLPGFSEKEFVAIKNRWDQQIRYEAEEMFWNGFGDCKARLHEANQRIQELEAELQRSRQTSKQQARRRDSCFCIHILSNAHLLHRLWICAWKSRRCTRK